VSGSKASSIDTVPTLEATGLRVAPPGAASALEIDMVVCPGQLHLVHSRDVEASRAIADALLGLSDTAQGEVRFRGLAWRDLAPRTAYRLRGNVGRVATAGNWMDTRSVTESLLLPLRHHTVLPDEVLLARASDYARRFGLPGLPIDPPGKCPDSDLERAACIRAFLGRPELVILEHPVEFVDTGILPPLVDAIQEVRRRRGAVIWFTRLRAVLEEPGMPADRRYRLTGRDLRELETAA